MPISRITMIAISHPHQLRMLVASIPHTPNAICAWPEGTPKEVSLA